MSMEKRGDIHPDHTPLLEGAEKKAHGCRKGKCVYSEKVLEKVEGDHFLKRLANTAAEALSAMTDITSR
jgi:hypothetical protein